MAEESEKKADHLPVYWRDVPSILVDGVLGTARAGGLHRIVLGEVVFNAEPGADSPALRPICSLVMTPLAVEALAKQLQDMMSESDG